MASSGPSPNNRMPWLSGVCALSAASVEARRCGCSWTGMPIKTSGIGTFRNLRGLLQLRDQCRQVREIRTELLGRRSQRRDLRIAGRELLRVGCLQARNLHLEVRHLARYDRHIVEYRLSRGLGG